LFLLLIANCIVAIDNIMIAVFGCLERQMWSRGILRPPITMTDHIDHFVGDNTVRYFADRHVYRYLVGGIQDDHLPFLSRGILVTHDVTITRTRAQKNLLQI